MKITEKEFEALEYALGVAENEGMLTDEADKTHDKLVEVYKRYRWFKDMFTAYDPAEYRREYIEEFGKWE